MSFIRRHPESEDAKLVERVLHGNGEQRAHAFRRLIERYQRPLYAVIAGIVSHHADADDVLQETFLRVLRSLEAFDRSQPIYPWLRRIAINAALSSRRSNHRQASVRLDLLPELPSNNGADNPLQRLEHEELCRRLRLALDRLPENQRLVFQLRVQQEMSYQEIADTLGIRVGTVMSRLSRARDKLRTLLRPILEVEVSS